MHNYLPNGGMSLLLISSDERSDNKESSCYQEFVFILFILYFAFQSIVYRRVDVNLLFLSVGISENIRQFLNQFSYKVFQTKSRNQKPKSYLILNVESFD